MITFKKSVANPKKNKNDIMSLAAHTMMEDEMAGSALKKFNNIRTAAPDNVAIEKEPHVS
ncbi:hypothetical protein P029_02145 [Anaplasma phagocytophilum str. Norway variant2]|uniref:Uncharacterized protein n=1 Tax=Anaplasma phagocytophilum str. Norway variant2 TaxID=1392507 RepID=A0A168H9B2_ANAPH|nr:hypothetical protein P029_02145 [Anaplasma phagocytophilum str. Norway variant2]